MLMTEENEIILADGKFKFHNIERIIFNDFEIPTVDLQSLYCAKLRHKTSLEKEAEKYNFDGLIVEVHHNPKSALTDAKQQLTWKSFDKLIQSYSKEVTHYGN